MADGSFDLDADVVELAPTAIAEGPRLREMKFSVDGWSPDEVDTLRELFAADVPVDEIALTIGRALHAVRTKICRLGLRRNSKVPWSVDEDAEILRRYGDDPTAAIAQDLGRSCTAVYQRAGRLGVTEAQEPPFTEWEDAQLCAGYAAGVPVVQIAALLGRSLGGVTARATTDLRLKHAAAPPNWTAQECARALELSQEGVGYAEIRFALETEGFPPRTPAAFKQMMRLVGFGRGWGRLWMEDEDELLRRAYAEGVSLIPLGHRLGRGRGSLRWRAGVLGLQGTHPNDAGWRKDPPWTAEQDDFVRANYAIMPARQIGRRLGRTRASVCSRAYVLGVKSDFVTRVFSADEDRAIEAAWRHGVSMTQVGRALNRDTASVGRRAAKIGYSFSDPARKKAPRGKLSERPAYTLADLLALDGAHGPEMPTRRGYASRDAIRVALRPRVLRAVRRQLRGRA